MKNNKLLLVIVALIAMPIGYFLISAFVGDKPLEIGKQTVVSDVSRDDVYGEVVAGMVKVIKEGEGGLDYAFSDLYLSNTSNLVKYFNKTLTIGGKYEKGLHVIKVGFDQCPYCINDKFADVQGFDKVSISQQSDSEYVAVDELKDLTSMTYYVPMYYVIKDGKVINGSLLKEGISDMSQDEEFIKALKDAGVQLK